MLGLGTLASLYPTSWQWSAMTPTRSGPAVEELLRCSSIVHSAIPRITTTDVEIAGVGIRPGSWLRVAAVRAIATRISSTTRGARHRPRRARGISAFGDGVHHCPGAAGRMETRIVFPALLRRFPALALAKDFGDVLVLVVPLAIRN